MVVSKNLEKGFEESYKKLNSDQKKAVDTIEGPVLVVAGPGTGKTTILTLRIAQILRKTQTPPSAILAITYTNAGVKAMREKLREVIGNTAHDVYIHTFHSFAAAMIAEYPSHFLELSGLRQMTEVEQDSIIRKIIAGPGFADLRPNGRPDAYVYSIVRAIGDSKKDALTPDAVEAHANSRIKEIRIDKDNLSTRGKTKGELKAVSLEEIEKLEKTILFSKVYQSYEEEKLKLGLRDFDDLITYLLVAMKTDELFLQLIQERFHYILVDEHQDTNDSQNYIVGMIAEFFDTPNIFVVGDEKQAIYRFQGASVENFLRLRKLWPDMKVINLGTNYRSHQSILDASFAMIENNYKTNEHKDLRVELKSGGEEKPRPIDVVISENNLAMEDYLVKEIKKISSKSPMASVAIIVRRNRELERVLRLLESKGVPVSSERSVDIFHHPLGGVFFDLIEYLHDPARVDALAKTIAIGLWGQSFASAVGLIKSLKKGDHEEVVKHLPAITQVRSRLLSDGAMAALIHIAEDSGFTALVSRDPAYVHVWRGIVALSESIVRESEISNPMEILKMLLEYRVSAESKPVKVSVGTPDLPIRAMTTHGSKGLEFDYVFIPYANDEAWIGRAHGSSFALPEKNSQMHNIFDTRRLFYVAITRARKHVALLYAKEESDGKPLTPLRFIEELHKKHVKIEKVERLDLDVDQSTNSLFTETHNGSLLVNEAKHVLIENGLSVTALNHFLECPSKFLYESILKLPQAPAVSAEKGSAMHEAISKVWALKEKKEKDIASTLEKVASDYIVSSLLTSHEKESLIKEIEEDAPTIAKALLPHFNQKGRVSTETWVERPFDSSFSRQKVTIPIHGKLDVLIENQDTLEVFDYKTRRSMSLQAIKGETKNDNGDYFRQIVFYKLLLQDDMRGRNKTINTSLVFLTPDDYGRCQIATLPVTADDIKKVEQNIETLVDSVWSGKIANQYCSKQGCEYCGYRKLAEIA